jgi:hypothetical protein
MTAITKSWVTIADAAIDPDSPIDAALMSGLRDDLVHLREWIGASYTGGAVQDHNHDGTNSAAIEVGPNYLRNGGFENGLTGWTPSTYTGGTIAVSTTTETEAVTGLAITSTVAANGGGSVINGEFLKTTAGQARQVTMTLSATVANCPIKADVIWYDEAQAQISISNLITTTTASPTTSRLLVRRVTAPSTAKYMKVKLELPAAGAAAGTVYFDSVVVGLPALMGGERFYSASSTFSDVYGDVFAEVVGGGGNGGTGGVGAQYGSGGGGGAGGFAAGFVTVMADTAVTVGSAGGTSSFGSLLSATGGANGGTGASSVAGVGGDGGSGSGGTCNRSGGGGCGGTVAFATTTNTEPGGTGGGPYGGAGGGYRADGHAAGTATGSGGGGGSADPNTTRSGGNGAGGYVLVRW